MANFGFDVLSEPLPDVLIIRTPRFKDERGVFLKGYHSGFFSSLPVAFQPAEQFASVSSRNVLRGMHFQVGKSAHLKLVSCLMGRVLDVIVDVRSDSPNYNKPFSIQLSEDEPISILIGKGYAHGFLSLSDASMMQYMTSTVHCPANDKGVLWSSIALDWPVKSPLISQRDSTHPVIGSEICTFS